MTMAGRSHQLLLGTTPAGEVACCDGKNPVPLFPIFRARRLTRSSLDEINAIIHNSTDQQVRPVRPCRLRLTLQRDQCSTTVVMRALIRTFVFAVFYVSLEMALLTRVLTGLILG